MKAIALPSDLELIIPLTDEQFFQMCQDNSEWKFERTATGEIIIMSPTGGITSGRNSEINFQLKVWNRQTNLGEVFDSSGGFILPNGATRSPDASWVRKERWESLSLEQQEKFIPLCPDFVIELLSPTDSLEKTRLKMQEYIENGAKLGLLINRKARQVEIYRPNQEVEILTSPTTVSGEEVLPGFVLDLTTIF